MAERGGKSVFPSNLRARLSAAEDDRMRPNNGKLSESVCLLKSNIQQQCYFLPKRCTSHIKLKLVKHQSFQQSSKRIFCTFIICINAALNYRFFWVPLLSNLAFFQLILCHPRKLAFFCGSKLQQQRKWLLFVHSKHIKMLKYSSATEIKLSHISIFTVSLDIQSVDFLCKISFSYPFAQQTTP